MKFPAPLLALLAPLALAACQDPTVVAVPTPAPVEVPVPVLVPVPGPAGPQGEAGRTGATGDTTVIVVPPASAPSGN